MTVFTLRATVRSGTLIQTMQMMRSGVEFILQNGGPVAAILILLSVIALTMTVYKFWQFAINRVGRHARALDDVSVRVRDGEFLVLIGLSGSGKSTLLRCINRLVEPTGGRIVLDGTDITAAQGADLRKIRRGIGMIFQQFNLVKRSTVLTNSTRQSP